MDKKELTDQIYDTLMQNVGMSEHHVQFDPSLVFDSFVDAERGIVYFELGDGTEFVFTIRMVEE